ncbi:MAG: hypothetical protein ACLTCQ_17810 [Enterocloster bolteae]
MESLTQRVSGIIQQANCDLRCLQYLQEQGLDGELRRSAVMTQG